MTSPERSQPHRVVVAGGGIAGLEAVLALRDLAGDRVAITLVAPNADFSLRPLEVAEPFSRGHRGVLPVKDFADEQGIALRADAVTGVDRQRRVVSCAKGGEEPYDSVILALGATARAAIDHALTFGMGAGAKELNGILGDLEEGWSSSIAFVVPKGNTWPLPLYELALMTAEEVRAMGMERVTIHLLTPESAPLGIFGSRASAAVAELLSAAGIRLHKGVSAEVPRTGVIETGFGEPLKVERIVALPVLEGPHLPGVPADAHGFITVDEDGRVRTLDDVYAAGDATDQPIKQGGLACRQADHAATLIAAAAGADVKLEPDPPVLHGRLLTGHHDRFLQREPESRGQAAPAPLWWPPAKVHSRYLAPYLQAKGLAVLPVREDHPQLGIDVRVPLTWAERRRSGALDLDTLGTTG
jgi:sulfide:quinone oxidoreductase